MSEQYIPSSEEEKKAEEAMSENEKEMTEERETHINAASSIAEQKKLEQRKEALKSGAEHAIEKYANPENSHLIKNLNQIVSGKKEKTSDIQYMIQGWDYLEKEIKDLALTAFPGLAQIILTAKFNKKRYPDHGA